MPKPFVGLYTQIQLLQLYAAWGLHKAWQGKAQVAMPCSFCFLDKKSNVSVSIKAFAGPKSTYGKKLYQVTVRRLTCIVI
jgi:hypothetical protein